jgi:oligopeptide/dipeptide ABC transporter ATP-binding protein
MSLLQVENVTVRYSTPSGSLTAVNGVSFNLAAGQTLGLVGESGCGKSTLARSIAGLRAPSDGSVEFEGLPGPVHSLGRMRRAGAIQMVFQDPMSSLNPRLKIGKIIAEPLEVHSVGDRAGREAEVRRLAERVGLPLDYLDRYPHELSGGQRQRVGIARSLALKPELIVCDEPVSALDVSVQAQVLNLLVDLQRERNIAYLFISHDLSVIRYVSHTIAVMYLGRIVEIGPSEVVWNKRSHPYTRALVGAIPDAEQTAPSVAGEIPSALNPPSGCAFRMNCPFAMDICARQTPELRTIGDGHQIACHLQVDV